MSSNDNSGQATFTTNGEIDEPETLDNDLSSYGVESEPARETRLDEPEASEFGIDDRPVESSSTGTSRQEQLVTDVEQATIEAETDEKPTLGEVYGATMKTPIPESERNDRPTDTTPIDSRELAGTPIDPHDFARYTLEFEMGHDMVDLEETGVIGRSPDDQEHYCETGESRVKPDTVDPETYADDTEDDRDIRTQTATDEYGNEHLIHYDRNSELCGTVRKHLATNAEHCPFCDDEPEVEPVTDGGQVTEAPDEIGGETVRLITGITGVMHTPEVIEGEASTSGKTISVEHSKRSHRLDTETILDGDSEFRDSRYFEIYTPERLKSRQRSNHAPGPQVGANDVSDDEDLPEATHRPAGEDERERERAEQREEAEKKRGERREQLGFEDVENGSLLIMDAHAGQFLVIRKVRQWDSVTGLELLGPDGSEYELTEATGDATYWLKDADDRRAIVSNVDAMDDVEAFDVIGEDPDRLRNYISNSHA